MPEQKPTSRKFLRGGRSSFGVRDTPAPKPMKLDKKTAELLTLLQRMGGNVCAASLSDVLDIPARTLRYRFAKLRKGHLGTLFTQTQETVLGLNDYAIYLESSKESPPISDEMFRIFKSIYFMSPCFGKYNGYLIRMSVPSDEPEQVDLMLNAFVDSGYVSDYFVFNNIDYISMEANLRQLDQEKNWNWNWEDWLATTLKQYKKRKDIPLDFNLNPEKHRCDKTDLDILMAMKYNAELTHQEIGDQLGLSASQVGKRIRYFQEIGLIKGYRWLFTNPEDTLYIHCYAELEKPNDPALAFFVNLPFPKEIQAETLTKLLIRMKIGWQDVIGFLHVYTEARYHLKNSFIQFAHDLRYMTDVDEIFVLFDDVNCKWEIPMDKYVKKFNKHVKG